MLFGGAGGGGALLGDTWAFDGARWSQVPGAGPPPRQAHAMTNLSAGVLLFGGEGGGGVLGDAWTFDGATWSPSSTTGPSARSQHAMGTVLDQAVVFGGLGRGSGDGGSGLLADTWFFDGASWTAGPSIDGPPARRSLAMATYASTVRGQELLLFGGRTADAALGNLWVSGGAAWTPLSSTGPSPRSGHAMASLGSTIVLFGGLDPATGSPLGDTWTYDGESWTELTVSGPPARFLHSMATFDGHVVLFGGTGGAAPLDDTWTFDGTEWAQIVTPGPSARSGHAMATIQ